MKRSRDDDVSGNASQLKRPVISDDTHEVTTSDADALTYIKDVEDIFLDRKDKYFEFIDVLKDFMARRIGTKGVIERVKILFKGNRRLILGFNTFLSNGYEIILSDDDEPSAKKHDEFEKAAQFIEKVKMRFRGDDHVYKSFVHILSLFSKQNKTVSEVHEEVAALLHNQPDLLKEFTSYLPCSRATSNYCCRNKPRHEDRRSPIGTIRPRHSEKISDDDEPSSAKKSVEFEEVTQFANKIQMKFRGDDCAYESFLDILILCRKENKSISELHKEVAALFHNRPDLLKEFIDFLPDSSAVASKQYVHSEKDEHQAKPIQEPDLSKAEDEDRDQDRDNDGVDRGEIKDEERSSMGSKNVSGCERQLPGSSKAEDGNRDQDHDKDGVDRDEIGKSVSGCKQSLLPSKDECQAKPIQEPELSNCEQCTPSYRPIPKNCPIPSVSRRTKIGAEVLNDHWECVASGSGDYYFKHRRKNPYEESLFRCEDDRFELDMLLEYVNVTARRVEQLLDKINDKLIKPDSMVRIEDHFTSLNLRCIERLYGVNGLDVMDVLRKNASVALPVILIRLKQKQEEWTRCRFDFNKIWAEVYAKNHHKSLDHRSFYIRNSRTRRG